MIDFNFAFVGRGKAGSWKVRGEQIADQIGVDAIEKPNMIDLVKYGKIVVVKRFTPVMNGYAGTIIWDVVDSWPQPVGNNWTRQQCIDHVKTTARQNGIEYMIAATEKMRQDLDADFTLYHHHRPGIKRNPIRPILKTIGYEGDPRFLGRWRKIIDKICEKYDLNFVINPRELFDVDVALRDGPWKGYATNNWKSNVKLANAQGSGTPIICNTEA